MKKWLVVLFVVVSSVIPSTNFAEAGEQGQWVALTDNRWPCDNRYYRVTADFSGSRDVTSDFYTILNAVDQLREASGVNWQWAGDAVTGSSDQGILHVNFPDLPANQPGRTTLSARDGSYSSAIVGFDAGRAIWLSMVLHEFGHVGGLGHVGPEGPKNPDVMGGNLGKVFGPGDKRGLKALGC